MLTLTVHKMYQELDSQGNLIYAFLQCLKTPSVTMHILADGYSIGGWLMVTVGQLAESIGATLAPELWHTLCSATTLLVQQSVRALQCSTSLRSSTSLTISLYSVYSVAAAAVRPALALHQYFQVIPSPSSSPSSSSLPLTQPSDPNYSLNPAAAKLRTGFRGSAQKLNLSCRASLSAPASR